jgi:hypothetical protein
MDRDRGDSAGRVNTAGEGDRDSGPSCTCVSDRVIEDAEVEGDGVGDDRRAFC